MNRFRPECGARIRARRPRWVASWLLTGVLLSLAACSSMQPVEMSPESVQERILSDDILSPGDRARIVTADGRRHKVIVRAVDKERGIIETSKDPVIVADIVALETREFSMGKTALLAVGSYGALALIAVALSPALLL